MIRAMLAGSLVLIAACVGEPAGADHAEGETQAETESDGGTTTSSTGTETGDSESSETAETSETNTDTQETESSSESSDSSDSSDSDTSDSDTSETDTGETFEPGACLLEVSNPQPSEFVGDGAPDVSLRLRPVFSQPPAELEVGSLVHVQGSYYWAILCGDDDVACNDSFVIRSYPDERFVLGQIDGNNSSEPALSQMVLDELGIDLDTWLAPFQLSTHDDLLCSWELGTCDNILTRLRLHVDAGECETAKLLDESNGFFGDVFFVAAADVELAAGGGICVDDQSQSEVFIVRQACAGPDCPETADTFLCEPDDQLQDYAEFIYGFGWEPPTIAVDHVCEVLESYEEGEFVVYELDCGELA